MKHSRILAVLLLWITVTVVNGIPANPKADKSPKVVYSYSSVTSSDDGSPQMSQLTIASASDGKYHFVKSENGTKKEGVWEGPLPETPDVEKLAVLALSDITKGINNPELLGLSSDIDSSIQGYLKKAMSSS